ncbi:NADH dehydrogenase [ubiquinone] 1 alpha subcomplex subunit 2 [Tribolium castaneum]|uniref:NADH dehydrogenase [ubiquinone] 1 alpha subcomplex subunit 2 n=1 Tax=Tribolium castaneum TaxID=7070 RepID=D6WM24_TRICA|nr:PREDICTED: NADH dehydrogenase [ubiquinone] 1 alpha subcomplex subunit 2 [Tribolium castaneum]EFA04600.1 NADH dehydrogenase [ubiquinone] 1 alpha subcomplex subunit 2-like Protein [Tribolium castaneum]|eukprot:XP_974988.1 PREDICTED: NADH dehydrogenase [ubiquinone] 1 alpha subcomplex subunit 2 [Tribolium castaneum]
MSAAIRFGARLKELRLHLCQKSASSQGVRDFIEQHYVAIKSNNPKLPILIRECSGVEPKLWARHELGKETCYSLKDLSASDILTKLQSVA